MKKLIKKGQAKGFTLTELVIVIVIIAILAAVLIPTYTGYVKKAKYENTKSAIDSMNSAYASNNLSSDYSFNTPSEAIKSLKSIITGFNLDAVLAYTNTNETNLVWNQDTKYFYLLEIGKDGNTIATTNENYPVPTGDEAKEYKNWIIYNGINNGLVNIWDDSNWGLPECGYLLSKYSVYLASTLSFSDLTCYGFGIDLGDNFIKSLILQPVYCEFFEQTNEDLELLVCTDRLDGKITTSRDESFCIGQITIKHYGNIGEVNVGVGDTSEDSIIYQEYGYAECIICEANEILIESSGAVNSIAFCSSFHRTSNSFESYDDTPKNVYIAENVTVNTSNNDIIDNAQTIDTTNNTIEDVIKDENPIVKYADEVTIDVEVETWIYDGEVKTELIKPEEPTTVIVPNGVQTLSLAADSLNIENVKKSDNSAAENVDKIILPDSVTKIDSDACRLYYNMTYINLDQVTYIGSDAFYELESLNCDLNCENVTYIGDRSFIGCDGLKNIYLSSKLKYIGSDAFNGCTKLVDLNDESKVHKIYFDGTQEEWAAIEKGAGWDTNFKYTIICTQN